MNQHQGNGPLCLVIPLRHQSETPQLGNLNDGYKYPYEMTHHSVTLDWTGYTLMFPEATQVDGRWNIMAHNCFGTQEWSPE